MDCETARLAGTGPVNLIHKHDGVHRAWSPDEKPKTIGHGWVQQISLMQLSLNVTSRFKVSGKIFNTCVSAVFGSGGATSTCYYPDL